MSRRKPTRESWQFTNDRYHTEYGSRKAIMEYMEDLPDIACLKASTREFLTDI